MAKKSFIERYKENRKPSTKGIPGLRMNEPLASFGVKGDVGIELEIEGRGLITAGMLDGVKGKESGSWWDVKADGSLRQGMEYVTSGPIYVGEIESLVLGLFNKARETGMVIRNSNRCSTHVHVNVDGGKVNHITSILGLWMTFESALISWCGEERVSNHFCLSSKDSDSLVDTWAAFLRTGKRPSNSGLKYTSLNILPIWRFGSVEFRCGPKPDGPEKTITWIKFCHAFVKYAIENYSDPSSIGYDISERGATTIFMDICEKAGMPENFCDEVMSFEPNDNSGDFEASCLDGFREAQPFLLGEEWSEWMEEIDKEYVPNPFRATPKKLVFEE